MKKKFSLFYYLLLDFLIIAIVKKQVAYGT